MSIKYYRLLDMLNKKGVSKGELQKMVGFSSATMAKISSHKPINLSVIDAICKALNCQPGDIMEYVEEQTKPNANVNNIPEPTTEWQRDVSLDKFF